MSYITEIRRKSVHLGSLVIPAFAVFIPKMEMVIVLVGLSAGMLVIDIIRSRNKVFRKFFLGLFGKVLRGKEQEGGMTASTVLMASAALTIFLFRTEVAVSVLAFLAVGDSFAAIIGKKYGVTPLVSGKTLEGSMASLLSCLLISLPILHVSSLMGWGLSPKSLAAGALAATAAELFEIPLDDNLRIPIFAGLVMELVIPG